MPPLLFWQPLAALISIVASLMASSTRSTIGSFQIEAVALGQDVEEGEDFLEPNLRFEVAAGDEETITIRVYFELESRPPWFFADVARMDDLWLDLRVDIDDLRAAAKDLRRDLARFPPRPTK